MQHWMLWTGCFWVACSCLACYLGDCHPVGVCKEVLAQVHIAHIIVSIVLEFGPAWYMASQHAEHTSPWLQDLHSTLHAWRAFGGLAHTIQAKSRWHVHMRTTC